MPGLWYGNSQMPVASATFTASDEVDGIDVASHTFTGLSVGTAAANRYVVAGVVVSNHPSSINISAVTIGGVAATELVQTSGTNIRAGLYIAALPTGTTANVAITATVNTIRQAGVAVWAVKNIRSTTATDTATDTVPSANVLSAGIDVSGGGICLGIAAQQGATGFAWSGLTEQSDAGNAQDRISSASAAFASAVTNTTVTATGSGGDADARMALAALR